MKVAQKDVTTYYEGKNKLLLQKAKGNHQRARLENLHGSLPCRGRSGVRM